jgi:prepilin-type N-terminal cleavage/methylation domain-containing protein
MPALRPGRTFAFTLIELLAVIVVISLLTGIVISGISAVRQRSNAARARVELAALANALEDYKRHYGDYPQLGEFGHAAITPISNITAPGTRGKAFQLPHRRVRSACLHQR